MALNDTELIARCIRRDKKAWDVFVERFSGLVYWSIRRSLESARLSSREDLCGDLFQEVFRKILEEDHLRNLKNPEGIRKYLSVMSCRLVWAAARVIIAKDTKERPLHLSQGPGLELSGEELVPDSSEGPGLMAVHRERDTAIEDVLSELTQKERECVESHFMDGRSHRETGELLGIPVDTVSTIIRRVREKIHSKFERRGLREYL